MSLHIILKRNRKKKKPVYKIVLINKDKKKKILDYLGLYEPLSNPKKIQINIKKVSYWLTKGASIKKNLRKKINDILFI